jgi:hypothetical protein
MLQVNLPKMNMAIILMIIDAQNLLTMQIPAFPTPAGSPYFFDSCSFFLKKKP